MATIITKFSSTASAVPTASDLVQGELAVNTADKRLFTEDSGASIIEIGTNPSSLTTGNIVGSGTLAITGASTLTGNVTASNDLSIGGNLTVTGNATISGNLTFGDADTDSISLNADVDSHILPNTDDTYDLGSTSKQWRNLYIDGTANIDSLVADTADINGGTVDGAIIGASSAAAGTFTTATATTGNITTVNATTVDSTNVEVTNLKAKDGTAGATIADVTGVITIPSSVLTTTDINGGTIDGAVIGGSSAAAGSFTTISASGTITGPSGTWDSGGVDIATGDTYAINSVDVLSATTLGSSVVNSSLTSLGTITSLVATTADINGGTIDGAVIGGSSAAAITGTTGQFNTSLNVDGTITADGLTVDGDITQSDNNPLYTISDTDGGASQFDFGGGSVVINADKDSEYSNRVIQLQVQGVKGFQLLDGGDISFYEDTGTTAKFFWDASAESLGIGTSSPTNPLHIEGTSTQQIKVKNTTNNTEVRLGSSSVSSAGFLWTQSSDPLLLGTGGSEAMRIDSSGNLLVGTTSQIASSKITVGGTNYIGVGATHQMLFGDDGSNGFLGTLSNSNLTFRTNNTERLRIDSSGNVGIGTDNPLRPLTVASSTQPTIRLSNTGTRTYDFEISGLDLTIRDATAATERMRIDSSGNLLVGKTSSALATVGVEAQADGDLWATADSRQPLSLRRNTTDGNIVNFWKDGTTVGSIGTSGGALQVSGNTNSGLQFNSSAFIPMQNGATIDATIDLGSSVRRFKDLYLSGGLRADTLTFSTLAGTEAARIDSSGNLLVGKTAPSNNNVGQQFAGAGGAGMTRDGGIVCTFNRKTSDGTLLNFEKDGTTVGSISVTTSATAYNTSSDQRLKENITDADDAGSKIDSIQVRQFDWKANGSHQDYGMIAQELVTVAPEAVHQPEDPEEMMGVDYSKLVPMLVKEIQSLRARMAQLEGGQ